MNTIENTYLGPKALETSYYHIDPTTIIIKDFYTIHTPYTIRYILRVLKLLAPGHPVFSIYTDRRIIWKWEWQRILYMLCLKKSPNLVLDA